jgi:hypothetical protein
MSVRLDLSIFNFKKRANATKSSATMLALRNKPSAAASKLPKSAVHADMAPVVVVDLENLTPETLEAFFPSEHAAPQGERATDNVKPIRPCETFGSRTGRPSDPALSKPQQETASGKPSTRLNALLNRSVAIFRRHPTKSPFNSSHPQNIEKGKNQ